MTQKQMFDGSDLIAPRARNTDPSTSHDAARHMVESGKLTSQQTAVLEAIRKWPNKAARELSELSGLDYYAIQRRVSELESQGRIVVSGETVVGGRKQRTWKAV